MEREHEPRAVKNGAAPAVDDRPYRRLSPLTPLVRSFIVVVAMVATSWDDLLRGDLGPLGWILLTLLIGGGIYGTASWLRTKYRIEGDELRVDTGVISRQSRRIRVDRLQGIDIVQPFVARLFGLAELRMDVAGGSAREGSLAFMSLGEARELKDMLLARRDAVRAERTRAATGPGTGPAQPTMVRPTTPPEPDRLLARVDLQVLVLSILLSGETFAFLIAAAVFGAGFLLTGQWAGLATVVPVLGGFVLVGFRRLTGYYNFTVSQTAAGMQVRRGMFELTSQTISLPRLQGVVVSEPLLWRHFGWARLDVSIAGYASGDDERRSPSIVMPVGDRGLVLQLARHMLDGADPGQVALSGAPRSSRWLDPVGWRFRHLGTDAAFVVTREGWFTRRTHVVPHARVQSLRVSQGPLQRALGLADLHVDSPPGPVNVRAMHRSSSEVRRLLEQEVVVSREARAALDRERSLPPRQPTSQDSGGSTPPEADTIQ